MNISMMDWFVCICIYVYVFYLYCRFGGMGLYLSSNVHRQFGARTNKYKVSVGITTEWG
jgi:hypothetical protein